MPWGCQANEISHTPTAMPGFTSRQPASTVIEDSAGGDMVRLSRRHVLQGAGALALAGAKPGTVPRERLIARIERDIQNLDPANRVGTVEGNIIRAVCQGLVRFKPGTFDIEPDAAASIIQTNAATIEFTLREGLEFPGYGPLTSEDVKFSFERFGNAGPGGEKAAYAADWAALDHVEVSGPYKGRLLLKHPAPALWSTALADISGAIVSRRAFASLGDGVRTGIVGSGPFQATEWVPHQRFVLRANPAWRGSPPAFTEIVLRPVEDARTARIALKAGEIAFSGVDVLARRAVEAYPATNLTKIDGIDYVWIGLNVAKAPLSDRRVRQAIRAAIDVEAVLLAAYDGEAKRARALIPPALLGYWPDAPLYRRDLAAAKALLTEAGYPHGFATAITVLNEPKYRAAGEIVQANLAELGIACAVDARDSGSFWSAGKDPAGRDLDLVLQVFRGKADPSFYTQWFVSDQIGRWNWQRWSNPGYDRLHDIAASTLDGEIRAEAFIAMQKLMDESAAFIWLTHDVLLFAARDWLKPVLLPNGSDWQLADFARV